VTVQESPTAVHASIVVDAPIERAFKVFTEEMGSWWPKEHHIIEAELAEMRLEPRAGGRLYDVGVDGSECDWSGVLVYEPPTRIVFAWKITVDFKPEPDPARASEIEVRFEPEGEGRTRVELEHRELQRHGEGWENLAEMFQRPDAWPGTLDAFAAVLAG
jgi:uncharacterized protein YndB with AHSA1/START domain